MMSKRRKERRITRSVIMDIDEEYFVKNAITKAI
jgi:hypothetical protein